MSPSPHDYIRHILDEIDYILAQVTDTDFRTFLEDATLKRAFVRSLEIIGEASKKLWDVATTKLPYLREKLRELFDVIGEAG